MKKITFYENKNINFFQKKLDIKNASFTFATYFN
jgi:hypothetical protein